ncbi:MAG TPA: transposase [Gaiellaceae bacterium]
MPRPLRVQVAGGIYHLVSRGVRKSALYMDTRDREMFLSLFELTLTRYAWELHTYCLMTNHFHMLVTTHEPTVSRGMQYLNGRYVQWFNWRHLFEGHGVERRFYSELVTSERQLFATARYILLNPVRAGLCASPADWPWSSYRATVDGIATGPRPSRWLVSQFGRNLPEARRRFAEFIQAGAGELQRARSPRPG